MDRSNSNMTAFRVGYKEDHITATSTVLEVLSFDNVNFDPDSVYSAGVVTVPAGWNNKRGELFFCIKVKTGISGNGAGRLQIERSTDGGTVWDEIAGASGNAIDNFAQCKAQVDFNTGDKFRCQCSLNGLTQRRKIGGPKTHFSGWVINGTYSHFRVGDLAATTAQTSAVEKTFPLDSVDFDPSSAVANNRFVAPAGFNNCYAVIYANHAWDSGTTGNDKVRLFTDIGGYDLNLEGGQPVDGAEYGGSSTGLTACTGVIILKTGDEFTAKLLPGSTGNTVAMTLSGTVRTSDPIADRGWILNRSTVTELDGTDGGFSVLGSDKGIINAYSDNYGQTTLSREALETTDVMVYWEVDCESDDAVMDGYLGVTSWAEIHGTNPWETGVPVAGNAVGYRGNGTIWTNTTQTVTGLATYGNGSVVMFAYDPATGELWTGVDGIWNDDPDIDPATYTRAITRTWIGLNARYIRDTVTLVSQAANFTHTIPTACVALATVTGTLTKDKINRVGANSLVAVTRHPARATKVGANSLVAVTRHPARATRVGANSLIIISRSP
jgi:hypothetical protein